MERKPTDFENRVYELVSRIPMGKISTYGEIAKLLGIRSARAVGQALRRNPYAPTVPCHRVVRSDGSIGGFYGETAGDLITKKCQMLAAEGISFEGNRVDFSQFLHDWIS
jgi:methylated-DNA-[protein]-cysteine S-methyltransferase